MKFSTAAIISILATAAYSQSIASLEAQIPSCALTCLLPAAASAGCGVTDFSCQCGSGKTAITNAAAPCIAQSCSATDAINAQSIANQVCALVAGGSSSATPATSTLSSPIASSVATSATSIASPSQVVTSGGNKLEAAGVIAGGAVLAVFAL